jgi:methylmalonyl-CoA/ethylmalonyl-CoA epimerase
MHEDWKFHHVGIVVRDKDNAIEFYKSLGIGPFTSFVGPSGLSVTETKVLGKAAGHSFLECSTALGGSRVTIIQPLEGGESVYSEFFEKKGEGLHHIAFIVDDLDKEIASMAKMGCSVIQSGTVMQNGKARSKYCYFDTDKVGGTIIELVGMVDKGVVPGVV